MNSLMQLVQGSAHHLPFLADGSIHAVITSPPYLGLRKYHGDQDIDWPEVSYSPVAGLPPVTVPAQRCALGAEAEPFAYIGHLILCLREWGRVLRDDGVCLVNLGDTYNSAASNQQNGAVERPGGYNRGYDAIGRQNQLRGGALKPKNLLLTPARFALAAQADGWIVRSNIIWAKGVSFLPDYAGSAMPESATDRPSRTHEDIFLLAKRGRYFWDGYAVREKAVAGANGSSFLTGKTGTNGRGRNSLKEREESGTRNQRSVWVINPRPFAAAHFACWPETLVDPMIRAATSERGCCPACGAPWVRVVERGEKELRPPQPQDHLPISGRRQNGTRGNRQANVGQYQHDCTNHGWQASCTCSCIPVGTVCYDPVPCTVLDPFSGSATTGKVAVRLGRRYVGVDLAAAYLGDVTDARMGAGVQMELV